MEKFVRVIDVPLSDGPECDLFFTEMYFHGRKLYMESSGDRGIDYQNKKRLCSDINNRYADIFGPQP